MRSLVSIKTLFRSPARTILTFVLLGIVTFAFFSQTAQYFIVSREFNNASRQYRGVGSAQAAPPEESNPWWPVPVDLNGVDISSLIEPYKDLYQLLTWEQIETISGLPYITTTDTRYMTAGVSDTYIRIDDGRYFYNFTSRCVIEGTLAEVSEFLTANVFTLVDCRLLAGNPPWEIDQGAVEVTALAPAPRYKVYGGSYGFRRVMYTLTPIYKYGDEYIQDNMTPGNRYVFTLRFEPLWRRENQLDPMWPPWRKEYQLSDYLSEPWCEAIWQAGENSPDYLESVEFAPLRTLIEITNSDMYTFDIVYTSDMGSIMRVSTGAMAIIDGRALRPEDSENGAQVCVVSREFADANGLAVGHTVSMGLGSKLFEQYKNLGALAVYPQRYAPPGDEVCLEIVGIYTDTDGPTSQSREPNWRYSASTIFVPKSLLHVDEGQLSGHMPTPAEFSYVVGNAWDIPSFIDEVLPAIEALGLTPIFHDQGWIDIAEGFRAARMVSIIRIVTLMAAVAASIWFNVFMFIGRKKKEYAIMRALGTTKRISNRTLVLPLFAVVVVSILVGSGIAWQYTVQTVANNVAFSALEGFSPNATIPAGVAVGCVLGELALTMAITYALLRRLGVQSPLTLLHDDSGMNSGIRNAKSATAGIREDTELKAGVDSVAMSVAEYVAGTGSDSAANSAGSAPNPLGSITRTRRTTPTGFVMRYFLKHIRRVAGRSALTVLVAALLFSAVSQILLARYSYTELFKDTVVKANFTGGLHLRLFPQILESGYVTEPYYELTQLAEVSGSGIELAITNNITRYVGEAVDIAYADGYDASVMDKFSNNIFIGRELSEMLGLEPGDTVMLTPYGFIEARKAALISSYRERNPGEEITDDEILTLYNAMIISEINLAGERFIIAGVVSTPSGAYDGMAFTPGVEYTTSEVFGIDIRLDIAEVTLADNFLSDDFRRLGDEISKRNISGGVIFIMDTSKLENLRNTMGLMEALYPLAIAAALLIGGFLCCLTILQSSLEAAIMRTLGTTKRKVGTMLSAEQILLNIAGLLAGACVVLLYKGRELAGISKQLLLFGGLFTTIILVCAVVISTFVTAKSALDLMQTKE